jgi:hypothetical protein
MVNLGNREVRCQGNAFTGSGDDSQGLMQIGAMDGDVGSAIAALGHLAQRNGRELFPAQTIEEPDGVGPERLRQKRIEHAQVAQNPCGVRAELNARAALFGECRAFEDVGLKPRAIQRDRRREPTNAPACNQDGPRSFH